MRLNGAQLRPTRRCKVEERFVDHDEVEAAEGLEHVDDAVPGYERPGWVVGPDEDDRIRAGLRHVRDESVDVESEVSVRGETTDGLALDGGTVGVLVEGWDGHSQALDAQTAEDADDLRRAVSDDDLLLGEAEGRGNERREVTIGRWVRLDELGKARGELADEVGWREVPVRHVAEILEIEVPEPPIERRDRLHL